MPNLNELKRLAVTSFYASAAEAKAAGERAGLSGEIMFNGTHYYLTTTDIVPGLTPTGFYDFPKDRKRGDRFKAILMN